MSIFFACDCGQKFTLPDIAAGKRLKCSQCETMLAVPQPLPVAKRLEEEDQLPEYECLVPDDEFPVLKEAQPAEETIPVIRTQRDDPPEEKIPEGVPMIVTDRPSSGSKYLRRSRGRK